MRDGNEYLTSVTASRKQHTMDFYFHKTCRSTSSKTFPTLVNDDLGFLDNCDLDVPPDIARSFQH